MGIAGAWDIIGEGETVALAQLSNDFFENHGRPFRIAVDEAGWRYNNLTPAQVANIREKEPRANPIEKAIFHRIMGLLKLNIHLLFVFDGPGRPWKRGRRGGGGFHDEDLRLTKCLLKMLGVPYYQAPAEAEAECAMLQSEGHVDAVWTDDSDAFMFGAQRVMRSSKSSTAAKSATEVKVFDAHDIRQRKHLDRYGFILFAMLAGGDYDTKGLVGCGPVTALEAAKEGLGKSLCETAQHNLPQWRQRLQTFLERKKITVPMDFPCPKTLKKYREPKVSLFEDLVKSKVLTPEFWDKPLEETKLRGFLREKFNITTKGYLKHITPWLLVRTLRQTPKGREASNNIYGIQTKNSRGKKSDDAVVQLQKRITFLPLNVTTMDITKQPKDEDWSMLTTKAHGPFDPLARVECEILQCLMRKVVLLPPQEATKKAKGKPPAAKAKGQSKPIAPDAKPGPNTLEVEGSNKTTVAEPVNVKGKKRKWDVVHVENESMGPKTVKKQKFDVIANSSSGRLSQETEYVQKIPRDGSEKKKPLWIPPDPAYLFNSDSPMFDASAVAATLQSSDSSSTIEALNTVASSNPITVSSTPTVSEHLPTIRKEPLHSNIAKARNTQASTIATSAFSSRTTVFSNSTTGVTGGRAVSTNGLTTSASERTAPGIASTPKRRPIVINLCDDSGDEGESAQRIETRPGDAGYPSKASYDTLQDISILCSQEEGMSDQYHNTVLFKNRPSIMEASPLQSGLWFTMAPENDQRENTSPEALTPDEPAVDVLRNRRLARFDHLLKDSRDTVVQDLVSTSTNVNSQSSLLAPASPYSTRVVQSEPVITPSRLTRKNIVTSSPLFVTPTQDAYLQKVIDLTGD